MLFFQLLQKIKKLYLFDIDAYVCNFDMKS